MENKENGIFLWINKEWKSKEFENYLKEIPKTSELGETVDKDNPKNKFFKVNKNMELGIKKDILIKQFILKRNYDKIRFKFLESKACRSLEIALKLVGLDVKTPDPIAVIEKRDSRKNIIYSYYITDFIEVKYNLLHITANPNHVYRAEVKKYLPKIARDLKSMHDSGLVHNDFHPGNILIKNIDTIPEFYYIDLNRARIKNKLSKNDKVNDLMRFPDLNQEEEEIFLENYDKENKEYWLSLMKKHQKRRHYIKSIRHYIKILERKLGLRK